MSYKRILENLRKQANELVNTAVINQNGCIGTLYKHTGKRYKKGIDAKRFEFAPVVAVMHESLKKNSGIGIFNLVEIFLDKKNGLHCTIEIEKDELHEVPFNSILSTYLYMVLFWLLFNGFIPYTAKDKETVRICRKCMGYYGDTADGKCTSCNEKHTFTEIPIDELSQEFLDNWYDSLGLMELVSINDYELKIFDPFNNYIAVKACAMIEWKEYNYEKKKAIWLKHYNPFIS